MIDHNGHSERTICWVCGLVLCFVPLLNMSVVSECAPSAYRSTLEVVVPCCTLACRQVVPVGQASDFLLVVLVVGGSRLVPPAVGKVGTCSGSLLVVGKAYR